MTIDELVKLLEEINKEYGGDPEVCHCEKDGALLDYINSDAVRLEFNEGSMWYA